MQFHITAINKKIELYEIKFITFLAVVNTVVDLAKKEHFQIACSKYFDAVHNTELGLGINHPNQYFEESQKLAKGIKSEMKQEMQDKSNKIPIKEHFEEIEEMDLGNSI